MESPNYQFGIKKKKNIDDFKNLYFMFHGNLVLFANKYTRKMQVSQDLVQDAFMNLWKQYQADNDIKSQKAYLFQAVRNNCLNYKRYLKNTYKQTCEKEWWPGLALILPRDSYLGFIEAPESGQLSNSETSNNYQTK